MRNHSAWGTRRQEVYRFTQTESFRRIIELRYALLPYIYSEYMKAALHDEMMFRPLSFVYPSDRSVCTPGGRPADGRGKYNDCAGIRAECQGALCVSAGAYEAGAFQRA